jgi:CheY-like chemotaxis protein
VLIVEDDDGVRDYTARVLKSLGYDVLTAAGGDEALRILAERAGSVAVLVADMVLPGMSGNELAARLAPIAPATKILFVSGHAREHLDTHGPLSPESRFLPKPYTPEDLGQAVRELIDHEPRP